MGKKLLISVLIVMLLIVNTYAAEPQEISNYIKNDAILMGFIAHAEGKTYITYEKSNPITRELYHRIAEINNKEVKDLGTIDELAGEEPNPQDHVITGMVQVNGVIYVSTERSLYRLEDGNLIRVPLMVGDKEISLKKLRVIIGRLTANDTDLFVHLKVERVIVTVESDNLLKTPLDSAIIKVSTDGQMNDSGFHMQKIYLNNSPSFAMSNDGRRLFFVYSEGYSKRRLGIHDLGENYRNLLYFDMGATDEYDSKVLMYKDRMITYITKFYSDKLIVNEVKEEQYNVMRDKSAIGGVYTVKSTELTDVKGVHFVHDWSVGDDGYIYMIGAKGEVSNIGNDDGYQIYKFKP